MRVVPKSACKVATGLAVLVCRAIWVDCICNQLSQGRTTLASRPPRPEQPCGRPGQSTAPITPSTPTAGAGEQGPLLWVLFGTGRTHRREVADEIRRARHQLQTHRRQAPWGQAADEAEFLSLPPVAEGKDRHPGAGLAVAGAAGQPEPDVVGEGAPALGQPFPGDHRGRHGEGGAAAH